MLDTSGNGLVNTPCYQANYYLIVFDNVMETLEIPFQTYNFSCGGSSTYFYDSRLFASWSAAQVYAQSLEGFLKLKSFF